MNAAKKNIIFSLGIAFIVLLLLHKDLGVKSTIEKSSHDNSAAPTTEESASQAQPIEVQAPNETAEIQSQGNQGDTIETEALKLLQVEDKTPAEIARLYELLPQVDINKFNALNQLDDALLFESALEWAAANVSLDNSVNMTNFFNLGTHLDGAYSEGYGWYIFELYNKDKLAFFKILSENTDCEENIFMHLAFELQEDNGWQKEKEIAQNFLASSNLSEKEIDTIKHFIAVMDNYLANGM